MATRAARFPPARRRLHPAVKHRPAAERRPRAARAVRRCFIALPVALVALGLGSCAPGRPGIELPSGPGVPVPDHDAVWDQAAQACRAVRSMQFMLTLGGRSGETTLRRTRMRAAVERPGSVRLEALAPFGAPIFVFVAQTDEATLLLPRERQVVVGARPSEVLDALAGLPLGPGDVRALLTGCLELDPIPVTARRYGEEWTAVDLRDGSTAYLREAAGAPVIAAGRRGDLTVEYADHVRGLPRRLRILARRGSAETDLVATLSRVNINAGLPPNAFTLEVPGGFAPVTLDVVRGAPPLEQRSPAPDDADGR